MVDTMLVQKLNAKMQLIELAFSIAYLYKCNIRDIFRTVVPWEVFIFNHLIDDNIAYPPKQSNLRGEVPGGWVKDPVVGMHGWAMTLDFSGLYPTIIRQWNISPETFHPAVHEFTFDDAINNTEAFKIACEYAKENNMTLCANGTMYDKSKCGFLPVMMANVGDGRNIAKKNMLKLESEYQASHDSELVPKIASFNNRQLGLKTIGNSGFGAIAQEGFYFYDYRLASAITLTGQLSDQHLASKVNIKLNSMLKTDNIDYVIYGDTDSLFVSVQTLVEKFYPNKTVKETTKFLDQFAKTILQPVINESVTELFESMNAYTKVMSSKREAIASKTLLRAKKNYAMYVHNSEGVEYDPPKLKVQGLEIVRASTPKVCKKWLKECVQMMFEATEMEFRDRYITIKEEFYKLNPEEISFPRGLSDMDKWADSVKIYKSRTPIHVRGALLYNKHIEEDALNNSDKIKFCYLKVPNTIRENVISYPTGVKFPESLIKFIDKDTMFEKTFSNPLKSLTDPAGWKLEEEASLMDFFG
jgi:DNA polymerase elongation subunit (family B)